MARKSRTTDNLALEFQKLADAPVTRRTGAERDRVFGLLMRRFEPQIRLLIRRYGLLDMADDARQTCAIGLFRALQTYELGKASFATHATWQLRGELQSLRHRMRLDQRQSARKAGMRTVSLETLGVQHDELEAAWEIVDDTALASIERAASDRMVRRSTDQMLERLGAPDHERLIVMNHLFDMGRTSESSRQIREQHRQIVRRTFRNCAKLVAA